MFATHKTILGSSYIGPMAPSASTSSLPAELVNDWLKPAAVIGALALLLAAFHGVRQEIKASEASLRAEIRATEASLRADLKADISELRADNRALGEKLDRVLESLLQQRQQGPR